MGWKYEVTVWGKHFDDEYSHLTVWGGQSIVRAMFELWKAKRKGFGCTTLHLR